MKVRAFLALAMLLIAAVPASNITLPNGWQLAPISGRVATVGNFPQGLALSPDGKHLAVVEGGYLPPAVRILSTATLATERVVALKGAFGRPVWLDDTSVLVPGANQNAVVRIDTVTGNTSLLATGARTWPVAIAITPAATMLASANDQSGTVSLRTLTNPTSLPTVIPVGSHPADLAFSGQRLFVALRGGNAIAIVNVRTYAQHRIAVAGHPCAITTTTTQLLVLPCDGTQLVRFSLSTLAPEASIPLDVTHRGILGAEPIPNALAVSPAGIIYVSLAGRNAVARVARDGHVSLIPAGWYPTGVALSASQLFVSIGNGNHAPPSNPQFDPIHRKYAGYTASSLNGAVAAIDLRTVEQHQSANTDAAINGYAHLTSAYRHSIDSPIRAHGPLHHVIYIIKENRSYDQVLGDLAGADGDAALAYFGAAVTPNQHALETQYGIFDRFSVDSRVSADGHNWTDAAIANDYVERFWPANYAGRRNAYDFQDAHAPDVPANGYLWDAAARAHITYRDYGEDVDPRTPQGLVTVKFPALLGHVDPHYIGWDLNYSDLNREAEWQREFNGFVTHHTLPQLEIVYLPNDHTMATKAGALSPRSYVATNDLALGHLVAAVSHSPYWKSTAIFVVEDDAQNGPDHVSDQRSTLYVASPYARGGLDHHAYDQASVLHTIEIILGLSPLTLNDRVAPPLYAAFTAQPLAKPYNALANRFSLHERNTAQTPGARRSARIDWSRPDAADPSILNAILARLSRLQK